MQASPKESYELVRSVGHRNILNSQDTLSTSKAMMYNALHSWIQKTPVLSYCVLALQANGASAPSIAADIGGAAEANIGPEAPGNEMQTSGQELAGKAGEKRSLLMQAAAARKGQPEESDSQKMLKEEQELLRNITRQKALKGVKELAKVSLQTP